MLGKATWSILHHLGKLWVRVMQHKYLKGSHVLGIMQRQHGSPLWKGILKARDEIRQGFMFRLRDGRTSFWYGDWNGKGVAACSIPYVNIVDTSCTLADLEGGNSWDLRRLYTEVPPEMKLRLEQVEPHLRAQQKDVWIWKGSSIWCYSVRDAYAWLQEQHQGVVGARTWIWKLKVPEKI